MNRLHSPRHGALILFATSLLTSSCLMTREQGDQLERDLRSVEQDYAVSKLQYRRQIADLEERLQKTEAQLGRVSGSLEKASHTDADFFIRLDELILQTQRLNGRLEELEHRLARVEKKLPATGADSASAPATGDPSAIAAQEPTAPKEPDPPALPEDKKALYDLAKQAHDGAQYDEARRIFRHFLGRFPDDPTLSDNALYWIGEGYFKEKIYDKAILTFQEVINKYGKSDKLDAALYKIGRSFEALGLKEDAVLFYEDLVAKYPKSSLVKDAKKRIKAVRKSGKRRRSR